MNLVLVATVGTWAVVSIIYLVLDFVEIERDRKESVRSLVDACKMSGGILQ